MEESANSEAFQRPRKSQFRETELNYEKKKVLPTAKKI
jgi:hypothetical protein